MWHQRAARARWRISVESNSISMKKRRNVAMLKISKIMAAAETMKMTKSAKAAKMAALKAEMQWRRRKRAKSEEEKRRRHHNLARIARRLLTRSLSRVKRRSRHGSGSGGGARTRGSSWRQQHRAYRVYRACWQRMRGIIDNENGMKRKAANRRGEKAISVVA
jgi:hypothetical protein